MRRMFRPHLIASHLYTLTAALLGLALLCCAALDWVAYTGFVISLQCLGLACEGRHGNQEADAVLAAAEAHGLGRLGLAS